MTREQMFVELLDLARQVIGKDFSAELSSPLPGAPSKKIISMEEIDRMEFIMQVEQNFDIEITDDEGEQEMTFGDLIDLIERKLAS